MTRRELVDRCLKLCELEPTDSLLDDEDSLKGLFVDLRMQRDTLDRVLARVRDADDIRRRFAWLTEELSPNGLYATPLPEHSVDRRETESVVAARGRAAAPGWVR